MRHHHHTTIHCQLPFLYKKIKSSYLSCQKSVCQWRNERIRKINYNRQYMDTDNAQSILNFQIKTRQLLQSTTSSSNSSITLSSTNQKKQFGHVIQEFTTPLKKKPLLNLSWRLVSLLGFSFLTKVKTLSDRQTDHFQNFYLKKITFSLVNQKSCLGVKRVQKWERTLTLAILFYPSMSNIRYSLPDFGRLIVFNLLTPKNFQIVAQSPKKSRKRTFNSGFSLNLIFN